MASWRRWAFFLWALLAFPLGYGVGLSAGALELLHVVQPHIDQLDRQLAELRAREKERQDLYMLPFHPYRW